jgi:hypothetical protein
MTINRHRDYICVSKIIIYLNLCVDQLSFNKKEQFAGEIPKNEKSRTFVLLSVTAEGFKPTTG